jgi:hypothetical protein
MRQRLDELRQVRKEAAVIAIAVCCGVPGLFLCLIGILTREESSFIEVSLACIQYSGKKGSLIYV